MQIRLTLRHVEHCRDIGVESPIDASVATVRAALGVGGRLRVADTVLDDLSPFATSVVEGDVLERVAEQPATCRSDSRAVLRVHVIGGPDSGTAHPLERGRSSIGRGDDCTLRLTDPEVSRTHLVIDANERGVTITDQSSTNGSRLDGRALAAPNQPWPVGGVLRVGSSLLQLVDSTLSPVTRQRTAGAWLVSRAPRAEMVPRTSVIDAPTPPDTPLVRLQLFAAALPAVGGVILALVLHNVELLLFALLTPLMIIGTSIGDRLSGRRHRRRAWRHYRAEVARFETERQTLLDEERARRLHAHPDPVELSRSAMLPDRRLWERRRDDPDFLHVRLGSADSASRLEVRPADRTPSGHHLVDVPQFVSLRDGPLGLIGPRSLSSASALWLVAQLATLHSPADVRIVLLLSPESAPTWRWARWLPHLTAVGVTDDEVGRALDVLAAGPGHESAADDPRTVLVVDRPARSSDASRLNDVLKAGCGRGVTAICVGDRGPALPPACSALAEVVGETGVLLRFVNADGEAVSALADHVTDEWVERVARSLAGLRDAAEDPHAGVPAECRFLETAGIAASELSADRLLARWQRRTGPAASVGRAAGSTFVVDLVRDGPHTLVAGTTGAGKSEFLQTLVAGLAVNNSPRELSFILIDYKGGAAFADCARLPHTAGLVTDLDHHLTERALCSLDAELRRRESRFADAGVADLEGYQRALQHDTAPLGRLVIVVDEFAALAEDLPDFVSGLIGIAQRGRSLGVHLVLATQRPGGAVSPEIRANASLRVALRTVSAVESSDVVGTDAAARIDKARPGRAFIRAGSTITEVQCARVGSAVAADPSRVRVVPLDDWARPVHGAVDDSTGTELGLVVDAAIGAATAGALAPVERPWLPPLPDRLALTELSPAALPAVTLGLVDRPQQLSQDLFGIDLRAGGNILLVGGAGSGRSTAVRTIAAAALASDGPSRVHLYVLDCAGGAVIGLGQLPHCGAALDRSDPAAIARVLDHLTAEVATRQSRVRVTGDSSAPPRGGGPPILLLVDGWEGFVAASDEHDGGHSIDRLIGVMRESHAVGLTVVITAGRAALTSRLNAVTAQRFILRFDEPADYALAGIPIRQAPSSAPPGRAISLPETLHCQFAYLGDDPSPAAQWRAIEAIAHSPTESIGGPKRIASLPVRVDLESLPAAPAGLTHLGLGGDDPAPVAVDLWHGEREWLVIGPSHSGRSTLLRSMAAQGVRAGRRVLVAAPSRSPLTRTARELGLAVLQPESAGPVVEDLWDACELLLVDDAEAFTATSCGERIESLLRAQSDATRATVVSAGGDEVAVAFRGLGAMMRGNRCGVLLQPTAADAELFGLHLPRTRRSRNPGRGIAVTDQLDGAVPIQIAAPS